MKLAGRLEGVSESATLKLNALAKSLQAKGLPVCNLTAGEPDFPVHAIGKKAIEDALRKDQSKYTPVAGLPDLRQRVALRVSVQQPAVRPWDTSSVVVSNGGKQAIFNTLMSLVDPGEDVLIPAPYWLSYPAMANLVGGRPRIIQTGESQKLSAENLERALSSSKHPKVLILNSPSNPTGAVYSRQEFQDLAPVLRANPEVWILSDEIYDELVYTKEGFVSFLDACPEFALRTVTVGGLSKSAALTGWRVGWSVSAPELASAITNVQSQTTSGINALAQWAGISLLDALNAPSTRGAITHQAEFSQRRGLVLEVLSRSGKIKYKAPEGAFYVFLSVEKGLAAGESAGSWCERVLEQRHLALVPGDPFGAPGWVRLSFATDEATLREGCQRLVAFMDEHSSSSRTRDT